MSEQNRPEKYDAVLGGQKIQAQNTTQPPADGVVLGSLGSKIFKLETLLQQQQWQAADVKTTAIILEICQQQAQGFVSSEDLARIDCSQWRTIDHLWKKYSNNHFGWSIQAEIWRSIAVTTDPDWEAWCRFGNITGWYVNDAWLHWGDVRFNLQSPRGHLPRNGAWMGWGLGDFWTGCGMLSAIVQKLENCQII
jgi:GUN4-like